MFSLLPDCAADAIRHQCRELNSQKLKDPCKRNQCLSLPSKSICASTKAAGRVGRRAGRRGEGQQDLTPGDRSGRFSCSNTPPTKVGQRRCLGVFKALNSHSL